MKKQIILLIALVNISLSKVSAQSFSVEYDTVTASVGGSQNLVNRVNNLTTGNLTITWNVIASDFPTDWQANAGICDNTLCISGTPLFAGTSYSPIYPPGLGTFYLLVDLATATSLGTHYVRVSLTNASENKTQTYIVTRTPVSVSVVKSDKTVVVYPNPVKNELKIISSENDDVKKVIVHDLSGKEILSYNLGNFVSQTGINVEKLPTGLYYVKLLNSYSQVVSMDKFLKE